MIRQVAKSSGAAETCTHSRAGGFELTDLFGDEVVGGIHEIGDTLETKRAEEETEFNKKVSREGPPTDVQFCSNNVLSKNQTSSVMTISPKLTVWIRSHNVVV
jgi:hypothetical protein